MDNDQELQTVLNEYRREFTTKPTNIVARTFIGPNQSNEYYCEHYRWILSTDNTVFYYIYAAFISNVLIRAIVWPCDSVLSALAHEFAPFAVQNINWKPYWDVEQPRTAIVLYRLEDEEVRSNGTVDAFEGLLEQIIEKGYYKEPTNKS